MAPPKPKSKQQAMPSMLKSMQRSVTVASAAVDNAFASSATGGVGQRSSVAAAQERHSLLANDGMADHPAAQASSPDRVGGVGDLSGTGAGGVGGVGAPKAPKLMKMNSRHIKMKKMMDNITTRLKLHSRGDNIAFGRRDRGDASGKSYNVEIPKNMIVLILIGFFLAPLAFGLYVLFRQLFMSEEVHSRYQHHSSGSGGKHPAAYHITKNGEFSNATVVSALNATSTTSIDGIDPVLAKEGESVSEKLPEVSSEAEDTTVGDHEDDSKNENTVADEKDEETKDNESAAAKDNFNADAASSAEKGTISKKETTADDASKVTKGNAVDNEEVDASDKSDEIQANEKGGSDDEETEETFDKDERDENADAKGESQVDADESVEEEKSSDENADGESVGTKQTKEKSGAR